MPRAVRDGLLQRLQGAQDQRVFRHRRALSWATATQPRPPHEAIARLDAITRRLRRECPWDREQDERTIVPHTVEEAYELADAAHKA